MSVDPHPDFDVFERRLQRLEHRFRRAQIALAGARATYGSLCELPSATALQVHLALQQVQRAQRALADLQREIELAQDQDHAA